MARNENSPLNSDSHLGLNISSPTKIVTKSVFKDTVYRVCCNDFYKPYSKLGNVHVPDCCNQMSFDKKCKDTSVKVIWPNILCSGPFFNILDNQFDQWYYDVVSAASSTLRPDRCFRGDVLRTLFLYILNGPSEELMWDIKNILSTHFIVHPPCTDQMKQLYLHLLDQKDSCDYFKATSSVSGILHHVINMLEDYYKEKMPPANGSLRDSDDSQESYENGIEIKKITYELMEERYNNYQPVLEKERNQVTDAFHDIDNISEESDTVTSNHVRLARLTVALELIVDLLEANFLICVSKLKRYVMGEELDFITLEPMIKHFMDYDLHIKVFEMYARTVNNALWTQLSRLVAMMAENVHMFGSSPKRLWKYPDLHQECHDFASLFFSAICECEWSADERLLRLQMLHPPWLQQQVAMWWANALLKVDLQGTDLKALVDIIHMHVQSASELKKYTKKMRPNNSRGNEPSTSVLKRAAKRNKYGETLLHILCKKKKASFEEIKAVLALPETDVNAKDNYGWTPLHEAIGCQSVLKTRHLLQYQPLTAGGKRVDIAAQNSEGCTPLHEAVLKHNLELCQLLVDYGGVHLLRKTDTKGETPLKLAKNIPEINRYFKKVIKTQEKLNLSPDSLLNLEKYPIQLLIVACNAFISDHHTSQIHNILKFEENYERVVPLPWIVLDVDTVKGFLEDQNQFRKLRKILNMLAQNTKNDQSVRLWNAQFLGCGNR